MVNGYKLDYSYFYVILDLNMHDKTRRHQARNKDISGNSRLL